MLNSLRIQNFRLFQDFKIENLARVNLLVGKNNVGKTTFLEAIELRNSFRPANTILKHLENRGEYHEVNVGYKQGIRDKATQYEIASVFHNYMLGSNKLLEITSTDNQLNSLKISYKAGNLSVEHHGATDSFEADGGGREHHFIEQKEDPPLVPSRGFTNSQLLDLWEDVVLAGRKEMIISMLQILDKDIEDIIFLSRILVARKKQRPIPLRSMGDGMFQILSIAIALANAEQGYLLVDEIDTGLHYGALTDVWRFLLQTAVDLNVQVFATTHSYDCIQSFGEALEQREDKDIGALFRLQKYEDEVEVVKYTAEELIFMAEQNYHKVEVR